MMKLENSVIINGNINKKSWRPVKEYLDILQSDEGELVERKIAEFVFKRIDRAKKERFYDLQPNQGIATVKCTPLDDQSEPLLGFESPGTPRSTIITTAKLLSHPYEVYEARIHLKLKVNAVYYKIVKRIVFKITEANGIYYKVYTDYCDKAKYSSDVEANAAVTRLAFICENIVTNTDFNDPIIKDYFSEGVYVND